MNSDNIKKLADKIGRPVKFMEVCGTHTMSAFRTGLRSLLPENVSLISGPGCPVCVTANNYLDKAIAIANQPNTIVTTFGDMVRVPGSETSLEKTRATGADIRIVYSPLDALEIAKKNLDKKVIFLGVGFETTTPTVIWTVKEAKEKNISNYSVLCAHKTIPGPMEALVSSGDVQIDGFMCPGHVSVIIGAQAYKPITEHCKIPCVISGFEGPDMAATIEMLLHQMIENRAEVEIQYNRSVEQAGNTKAQALINEVLEECDANWRGLGVLPASGLKIREEFANIDADIIFDNLELPETKESPGCLCGSILKGTHTPLECPLFAKACTPESPVGACMVSSEGTCAAYYKYTARKR